MTCNIYIQSSDKPLRLLKYILSFLALDEGGVHANLCYLCLGTERRLEIEIFAGLL